jgi:hypothetical protein
LALVDVVASDEEGGLSVVALEDVQDVGGKGRLWAIVVGESNGARVDTVVDTSATVLDVAKLGASNRRGVGAGRGLVLGASRAELVVAAGRVAVVVTGTAVYRGLALCKLWMWLSGSLHPAPEQHKPAAQVPMLAPHSRSSAWRAWTVACCS